MSTDQHWLIYYWWCLAYFVFTLVEITAKAVLKYTRRLQQEELDEVLYHAFNPDPRLMFGGSRTLYDPEFSCSRCCLSFNAEEEDNNESTMYIFNNCSTYTRTIGIRRDGRLGWVRGGLETHNYCYKCVVAIMEEEQTKWDTANNMQMQVSSVQILFRKMLGLTAHPLRLLDCECPAYMSAKKMRIEAERKELKSNLNKWSVQDQATSQDAKCPVCLEQPTEGRMLILCGHILCSPCLRELIIDGVGRFSIESDRYKTLKCPLCREHMFPHS